jgi:hypothetical protein
MISLRHSNLYLVALRQLLVSHTWELLLQVRLRQVLWDRRRLLFVRDIQRFIVGSILFTLYNVRATVLMLYEIRVIWFIIIILISAVKIVSLKAPFILLLYSAREFKSMSHNMIVVLIEIYHLGADFAFL